MKIVVKNPGRDISLALPAGLVMNGLSARIVSGALRKKNIRVSAAQLRKLFREVRRYKRRHSEWTLAEVWDAYGSQVTVRL